MEWKTYLVQAKHEFDKRLYTTVQKEATIDDYYYIKTIGKGKYGKVMLYRQQQTGNKYAVKLLKAEFTQTNYNIIYNEKEILRSIYFPFTIHLVSYFYYNKHLYLVLPLVECGDLFLYLQKSHKFNEIMTRFYAAQVLLALEYLHYLGLIYRDIKAENILLDIHGYIRLTDFGFCKKINGRTYTFCGTPEYIAPEIIKGRGYGQSVDYWSLGVLIYELAAGVTPFYSDDSSQMYKNICKGKFRFREFFSEELKDLLLNLLEVDTSMRYGCLNRGVDDIKNHEWFKKIYWIALFNKELKAPYMPCLEDEEEDE